MNWWETEEFAKFIPYIVAQAANDKRDGKHSRLELRGPYGVQVKAAQFVVHCVSCGASIHPFRVRKGGRQAFLAVTCPLNERIGCSRGRAASNAYDAIEAIVPKAGPSKQREFRL